jgi:hypothetical protein
MSRFHNIDGVKVQFTAEEETARDVEEQAWADGALARALAKMRFKRNQILSATDFYALSDVTMSEAMTTYRQELRDLTNGLSTVEAVKNVTYPTKPGE